MLALISCRNIPVSPVFTQVDDMALFESSEHDLSIQYPSGWIAKDLPDGNHGDMDVIAMFYTLSPLPAIIMHHKEFENPTLENVASWGQQRIFDRYDEHKLEDINEETLANQEVLTRTYLTSWSKGTAVRSKDVYIVHDDSGIILTLRATVYQYDDILPVFDAMVDSFIFTDQSTE
jgi:hypothetical protein